MADKPYHLSAKKLTELKAELERLTARRTEIAEAIATAREQGDLRENSEYQSAKEDQSRNEIRIADLKDIIKNAVIVRHARQTETIVLGSDVSLQNLATKQKQDYSIVGTIEANPLEGKLSNESPVGQALIGKTVGEEVMVDLADKQVTYKVLGIK